MQRKAQGRMDPLLIYKTQKETLTPQSGYKGTGKKTTELTV